MEDNVKRIVIGMALLLAATGLAHAQAAGDPVAGKVVFAKCMICHKVGVGAMNGVGPQLNGIIGRKSGTVPGYMYSEANKTSNVTWTEDVMAKYLPAPMAFMPGTKMTFPGLTGATGPADVANVISYLKTFKADGTTQ
jgi:cytochrome c